MPDKKGTYPVNESALRNALLRHTVEVNTDHCNSIEQEVAGLRMQRSIVIPDTKVLARLVLIPVIMLALGAVIFYNFNSIKELLTPSVKAAEVKNNAVISAAPQDTKSQPVSTSATPSQVNLNNQVAKPDTHFISSGKLSDSSLQQASRQANPVIAAPPTDSAVTAVKKEETQVAAYSVDSATLKSASHPVKKKKRRRHSSLGSIDDIRESALQPNSADDEVVVPQ
jgi:hypothetical protein